MKVEVAIEEHTGLSHVCYVLHVRYRPWWFFWSDWREAAKVWGSREEAEAKAQSIVAGNYIIERYGRLTPVEGFVRDEPSLGKE